jgi:hypothetical protein
MEQTGELGTVGRQHVEAVVQTLASLGSGGESLAEVAHDARNMVTALGLYCDLLEEPGVLAVPFAHYGSELRLVAAASRRLVEKLAALDAGSLPPAELRGFEPGRAADSSAGLWAAAVSGGSQSARSGEGSEAVAGGLSATSNRDQGGELLPEPSYNGNGDPILSGNSFRSVSGGATAGPFDFVRGDRGRQWETMFSAPVSNLAAELLANRNLLSALAGPGIAVTVDAEGGAWPVRLSAEDLTRLLVNLVKNASEAIPASTGRGHIQIGLRERAQPDGAPPRLVLAIEDNGPGIAAEALDRVFESGFTTHPRSPGPSGGWPVAHRGLGLAITRSIVEASGGRIAASNRDQGGARIEIELPVRTP